jgi:beta-N-acetylhexosaminidase
MTDILRGTCGYQGLILSDDMEMGAMAKHYAFSDMGVMAIKAGADIVLVCHDYGHEKETFEGMLQAYKTDPEFQRLADEKVMRIVRTKLTGPANA